jgi:hypothetical protein
MTRPNVAGTTAVVQATARAPKTGNEGFTTPAPTIMLDEAFSAAPTGWPNKPTSTAWYADGSYQIEPREPGHFVAIDAPTTGAFYDGTVTARFRKTGGPPGGGYGLIVADQGPEEHDGVFQGGRFVVLEVGDQGTIGGWQRENDHWRDLQPWKFNAAVHEGNDANELTVRAAGQQLTFIVNGAQVAQVTTKLPAGRIGVFVGGDGNQVTLEHFAAQWPTQVADAGAQVTLTPTAAATAGPARTPVPTTAQLLSQLDAAWGQGRWSDVQTLLDRIEAIDHAVLDFTDKRYAAHVLAGQDLLAKGNKAAAAAEFSKAQNVDPERGEGKAALIALTPTPTPVPSLPSAGKPLTEFLSAVLDDVDEFWSVYFSQHTALRYTPAKRYWYDKPVSTACGRVAPGVTGSFYCPLDSGLYLDAQFLQTIRNSSNFGDFPVAYVVAHEVGHHVQHEFGLTKILAYIVLGETFSREIELQADCLAGVWSKSATTRKLATPADITQAVTLAWTIGDAKSVSQRSSAAHGTPDDRAAAFLAGFNANVPSACGLN